MNKLKRKIISGCILAGGILCVAGGSMILRKTDKNNTVPVSAEMDAELPIIVLDAGHGESA